MKTIETIHSTTRIGDLVAADWRMAEVFKKYGVDFCCGGKRTIAEACSKDGLDINLVVSELNGILEVPSTAGSNFNHWDLDFLVDYIINNHHKYVKASIPFLSEISLKVVKVHGSDHPELMDIWNYLQDVIAELTMHMEKEEIVLFPYIKQLAVSKRHGNSVGAPPFITIANPISIMEAEHTSAGAALEAIEKLSNHFSPPENACTSYRVLFAKLQEFQQDLHQHVHLENNILFPKSLQLEKELMACRIHSADTRAAI